MRKLIFFITLFVFSVFSYAGENNLLYNISNASIFNKDNYLIEHNAYTLSYSNGKCESNWVAWHLEKKDLGDVKRNNNFIIDPLLPKDFCKASSNDYKNSGYDRGHQCPSADRTKTEELNRETFYMSNIMPQTKRLNQVIWNGLEKYLRDMVKYYNKEIYIYSGGIGGKEKIKNKILIPDYYFKVAIIMDDGVLDYMRIDEAKLICVLIPNQENLSKNWKDYVVDIKKIEELTGLNFSFIPKKNS